MEFERREFEIRPYTLKELARMYKANRKTFRKWLSLFKDELGPRNGHYYTIPQVKIIFKKLDLPATVFSKNKPNENEEKK